MNVCLIYSNLMGFMSMIMFINFIYFILNDLIYLIEIKLFVVSNLCNVNMMFLFDWMSFLFMSFVLLISFLVIKYSEEYMNGDLMLSRFILLVSMFVLSMMMLIISPNLISILLGWDGLGLVSYCLVIYYQNIKSFNAGMLTALSNRVGDVALLISISWMLNYGSWSYYFYLEELKNSNIMILISILVVLAAFTKSAQIPFSSWLPAAMAAPTPVSSLVHSSTLVTAGVYLLIRFNFLLSDNLMWIFLFISMMTMFMSGLAANLEFDLKKIIALSTLSQLGFMMSILFLGSYKIAFFHLLIHALFKALLFMCAGNMIHNLNNCQDIRYMGNLVKLMPLTITFFNISNMALCGLPFLSGFYSKDLIMEFFSMQYFNLFIYLIFYISVGLTMSYSIRLVYYTSISVLNFISLNSLGDKNFIILKSMGGLILFVIFMGSMLLWLINLTPFFVILPIMMKLMTLIMIFIGSYVGLEMSKLSLNYELFSKKFKLISYFISQMWFMPYIFSSKLNLMVLNLGFLSLMKLDNGWSEYLGGQKSYNILKNNSLEIQIFMKNNLKIFFMLILIFLVYLLI
uniref:NADH-ubiquinone oxidoreductase chain 5 n=1 Tax=Ischalia sp. BMNH 840493 TaxID=904169 RepID=I7F2Y0_9CUCU|nr:NADH dehydrogenase subunit 5 [Ischalia sp. BMNH 840493]